MKSSIALTLVEVLISIAVIGIMFAALAALQVSNIRVTSSASRDTQTLEKAVDVFEAVKRDVEAQFGEYNDCPGATTVDCTPDDIDPGRFTVAVTIDGSPYSGTGAGTGTGIELLGVIEVIVEVDDAGKTLEFRQFVPCLDDAASPTISDPGECLL